MRHPTDPARNAAKLLKRGLDDMDLTLQLTACQAVVAKSLGFNDWLHLVRTLGTNQEPVSSHDRGKSLERFRPLLKERVDGLPENELDTHFGTAFRFLFKSGLPGATV